MATHPLSRKRDFDTSFSSDQTQPSPRKKSKKDAEPQISIFETPTQPAPEVTGYFSQWLSSSLNGRISKFKPQAVSLEGRTTSLKTIDDTIPKMFQQAQMNYDAGRELTHQPNKKEKNQALDNFISAGNIYIQLGQKKPPALLFQIMRLQYELKNFSASIETSVALAFEGDMNYFIPIQINQLLCYIELKNWSSFDLWINQFKHTWTEWFWLNPASCPLSKENCDKLDQSIKKTISLLENKLASSQETLEKEKLLQALFTLSFAREDYSNASVFANQLREINPFLAYPQLQLCYFISNPQYEIQQISYLFRQF